MHFVSLISQGTFRPYLTHEGPAITYRRCDVLYRMLTKCFGWTFRLCTSYIRIYKLSVVVQARKQERSKTYPEQVKYILSSSVYGGEYEIIFFCKFSGQNGWVHDGAVYASGESFLDSEGCNTCTCSNGAVICTLKYCVHTGFDSGIVEVLYHYISLYITLKCKLHVVACKYSFSCFRIKE